MKLAGVIVLVVVAAGAVALAVWSRSKVHREDETGPVSPAAQAEQAPREAPPIEPPSPAPIPVVPPVTRPVPIAVPTPTPPPPPPRPRAPSPVDASAPRQPTPAEALQVIQTLVKSGKTDVARELGETYLKQLPDGPETQEIRRLTATSPP